MNSQTFRPIFLSFALLSSTLPGNLQSALPSAKPATKAYLLKAMNKIGPYWYQGVVKYGKNLSIGTVHLGFRINPDGRIENLKVLSNTSNQLLADISRHAIEATKLPPIPQKALAEQGHHWIEMDLPFSLFANPTHKNSSTRPRANTRSQDSQPLDLELDDISGFQPAARVFRTELEDTAEANRAGADHVAGKKIGITRGVRDHFRE